LDECEEVVADDAHHGDGRLGEDARESASAIAVAQKTAQERQSLPKDIEHASLEEKCDWMIQQPVDKYCNLFSRQSFILVGFDEDNNTNTDNGLSEVPVDSSRLRVASKLQLQDGPSNSGVVSIGKNESEKLKGKISKLIRRAGGTIFWEPNEWITNVLLNDNYSKYVWDDVRYFCREHPKGPICVTVEWALTSIYHQTKIAAPPFPPEPQSNVQLSKRKARGSSGSAGSNNNTGSIVTKQKSNKKSKQPTSSIFRGDVFAIVPMKPMDGTLDFRLEDMESTIVSNAGLLLSKSLLLAIKKDAKSATALTTNPDRKYFVVSPRWCQLDCATSFPLLAELSKVGIQVVPVSPVFVASCIENNYKYDPEEYPLLFQPQTWSIRLWKPPSEKGRAKFLISVTGFVDSSRYGIMSMLKEIGAAFTDNLSRKNTHLICKEAQGAKYTKALEWGLHAVSIEWLYHIIRYGYGEGSEVRFSLAAKKEPGKMQQPVTSFKTEKESEVDAPFNRKGNENTAPASVMRNAAASSNATSKSVIDFESKFAMDVNRAEEQQHPTDNSPSSQSPSSPHRRGKRDPPQPSPIKHRDPPQSSLKDHKSPTSKRLHFALQALEAPAAVVQSRRNSMRMSRSPGRRGKRDRSPVKGSSQDSTSLLSRRSEDDDEEEEEENTQIETQFTTGTIRANADITGGMALSRRRGLFNNSGDDSSEVPLSQANDAEDNGESQVVWYGA